MNTNDIETLVLLGQSGEITPADRARLDAAVAADPAVATLVARLDRMTALARTPGRCFPDHDQEEIRQRRQF